MAKILVLIFKYISIRTGGTSKPTRYCAKAEPEVVLMSHRFFISILYSKGAKILAPFEYVIYEENQIGFQWRLWPCEGRRPESDLAGGAIGN